MNSADRQARGLRAVNLGLTANVLLAALKTSVGIVGHSPALLAEGVNSTSDVAYYIVVSIFMRLARKPADDEHPYGHAQLESIAALLVGSFVIATSIAIFWDAVSNIYEQSIGASSFQGASWLALGVALLTILVKLALTVYTQRMGAETENQAIIALASDHRNDVFSASGAAVGIFLGRQGFLWVDPLAGALVALIILRTGVEIIRQSSAELMDTVPSSALARQIQDLLRGTPGVLSVEEIHAHRFGPYFVLNITIGVDGEISVRQGDEIASQVEQRLYSQMEFLGRVHIHYHPRQVGPSVEPLRLVSFE